MSTDPWSLSRTAASNTVIGGVSAAEGILPANLNNIDRALGAGLAELVYVLCGAITSAGSADAQTVTTSLSWASYAAGKMVSFKAGSGLTNTGACTLNVDGLGPKSIKDNAGNDPAAGAITAGGIYLCAYEATADAFLLLNPYAAAGSFLANVVEDTTPQLGAALDANSYNIGFDDGTGITDDSGNEQLLFGKTASAVNYFKITNAATGNSVTIAALGDDTDIGIILDAKGAGLIRFGDSAVPNSSDGAALGSTSLMWSDLFLASGAVVNFNNGDVTITHSSNTLAFAGGTAYTFDATPSVSGSPVRVAGKETIWVPAGAMKARTTNGAASGTTEMSTNKNMFVTLDFDTTTQEFGQFFIRMPKNWNESTVSFLPVWSHASTTTNFGVVFGLAGVAISNDDAGDVAFGTAQTSTDTGGTTNDIYQGPESSAITIAGSPAAGDYVMFQVNRTVSDGSDTMAIDARLHGIVLFITTDAANDA